MRYSLAFSEVKILFL